MANALKLKRKLARVLAAGQAGHTRVLHMVSSVTGQLHLFAVACATPYPC